MLYGFDGIRQILFEEASEEFRVEIRDCADNEENLYPGNGNQCVERIANRQRMNKCQNKEDANPALEFFPVLVVASG
jgi:hypothetical protein